MSHRDTCPSSWNARREGERAGERGYGSNPYDDYPWNPPDRRCEEAADEWKRGYRYAEERREEEAAEERAAERRAQERREEQRYEEAAYEEQAREAYERERWEQAQNEQEPQS